MICPGSHVLIWRAASLQPHAQQSDTIAVVNVGPSARCKAAPAKANRPLT